MKKRLKFTDEQKEYILNNWDKETNYSMCEKLNCSLYLLKKHLVSHNLVKEAKYTPEIDKMLEVWCKDMTVKGIASKLGFTEDSVRSHLNFLGLKAVSKKIWSKEEENELKMMWGNIKIESIANHFGVEVQPVRSKACKLGLGSMLDNNNSFVSIKYIAEIMGVSDKTVSVKWKSLGLKITTIKLSNNFNNIGCSMENLIKFLEQNQAIWDSKCVDLYALGYEPEWLIKKRTNDRNNLKLKKGSWNDREKKMAIYFKEKGKSYQYIANYLNRSEGSVMQFFSNNSKKEEYLQYIIANIKKEEPHVICRNIRCNYCSLIKILKLNKTGKLKNFDLASYESAYFKKMSKDFTPYQISKKLSISKSTVVRKLKLYQIEPKDNGHWSDNDSEFLIKSWGSVPISILEKKFKKTKEQIEYRANYLGLGQMVRNNYDLIYLHDLTEIMGVNHKTITNTWIKKGLKPTYLQLTPKRTSIYFNLNDILDFLFKNQNLWDSRKLKRYALGIEPDWLFAKREKDHDDNLVNSGEWLPEERSRLIALIAIGKDNYEIAKILNRKYSSVKSFISNYNLRELVSKEQIRCSCDNYNNLSVANIEKELLCDSNFYDKKVYVKTNK